MAGVTAKCKPVVAHCRSHATSIVAAMLLGSLLALGGYTWSTYPIVHHHAIVCGR